MATITKEEIDALNAVVKINVDTTDYESKVDTAIKDYTKKIDLKGFRKGKVPKSVIKNMFGNQILGEELSKIVDEELNAWLKDNDVKILGHPLPKADAPVKPDINETQAYEFVYELGLAPDFEVNLIKDKASFTEYKISVDDDFINEQIDSMRKQHGKMTNPDDVQEGDVLYMEFVELENGAPKEGGVEHTGPHPLDMIKDKKVHDKVLKWKKGDSMEMNLPSAFDKEMDDIAKHVLQVTEEKEINPDFKVTLKNVNRADLADLDQEFFDKVYGEGVVNSEEELRAKVNEEVEPWLGQQADRRMFDDMVKEMIEKTEIPLPDDFLKRWIKLSNEKPVTDEQIEEEYDGFVKNLKWSLIVNKVTKEQGIEVTKEELEEQTRNMLRQQLAAYGSPIEDDSYLDQLGERFMQDEEHLRKTADQITSEKLFGFFKETFKLKQKDISYNDFIKLD